MAAAILFVRWMVGLLHKIKTYLLHSVFIYGRNEILLPVLIDYKLCVCSQIEATHFSVSHPKVEKSSVSYYWKLRLLLLVAVMDAKVL